MLDKKLPVPEPVIHLNEHPPSIIPPNTECLVISNLTHIKEVPRHLPFLQRLILSNNSLTAIPADIISLILGYKKLEHLDLSSNLLDEYPPNLESLDQLKRLILSGNHLTCFRGSFKTLEELDLDQNSFTELPRLPPKLRKLSFSFNRLTTFSLISKKLKHLSLSMNCISELPTLSLPKLEFLDLSKNSLQTLPDLSKACPKLEILDITANFLSSLPKLPTSLKELYIRQNRFVRIPDLVKTVPNLSVFDCSENDVTVFPTVPDSITIIFCEKGSYEKVNSCSTPHLRRLYMIRNQLQAIPRFKNNEAEEIFLFGNCITAIDLSVISKVIRKLDLFENEITSIPSALFALPRLTVLNLARNKIREIPPEWRRSSLEVFNISCNPIGSLPNECPPTLLRLYISFCNIAAIPDSFSALTRLKTFVACGNSISSLPLFPNCHNYYLSQNAFADLPPLPAAVAVLDLSRNRIRALPDDFAHPSLTDLDLSHNDLARLPARIALPELKFLKFSHNPRLSERFPAHGCPNLLILNVEETAMQYDHADVPDVREFMCSSRELIRVSKVKVIAAGEGVGFCEMNGVRDSMEDSLIVHQNIRQDVSVFAVFDGHGGWRTASASAWLFARMAAHKGSPTAKFMLKSIRRANEQLQATSFSCGSTAAIVVRQARNLAVAHVGDSRCYVLRRDGTTAFQTVDHKPTDRTEYERIRDAGGKVVAARTAGLLSVSRAIGDFRIPGVGYEPDIVEMEIEDDYRWIVLGCDGVWDVTFPRCLRDIARSAESAMEFAYRLRNTAFACESLDNISTIVVDLAVETGMSNATGAEMGREERVDEIEVPSNSSVKLAGGVGLKWYIRAEYDDAEPRRDQEG